MSAARWGSKACLSLLRRFAHISGFPGGYSSLVAAGCSRKNAGSATYCFGRCGHEPTALTSRLATGCAACGSVSDGATAAKLDADSFDAERPVEVRPCLTQRHLQPQQVADAGHVASFKGRVEKKWWQKW